MIGLGVVKGGQMALLTGKKGRSKGPRNILPSGNVIM
jgi:hypothetical protein